ncbi:MAG: hypothetical protein KAR80_03320, partial [Rhodospirillaceae bacterium]|nr:hypothetical protein [Rhodospirillaceae bacterium]
MTGAIFSPENVAMEALTASKPQTMADHFATCSRLGRYLTLVDSGRFVISDDLISSHMPREAVAFASICSKDEVVARAAL